MLILGMELIELPEISACQIREFISKQHKKRRIHISQIKINNNTLPHMLKGEHNVTEASMKPQQIL